MPGQRQQNPCIFAALGGCDRARQEHHVVPQQRIRRRHATLTAEHRRGGPKPWPLTRALRDPRFKVSVCWVHHQRVEGHSLHITADVLPPDVWTAADEYGLRASLEHDFSRGKLLA